MTKNQFFIKNNILKIVLFSFLITFSMNINGQTAKKRIARGNLFYKLVRVREVLDTMLWKEEAKIFNNTEKFFKEHGLDPNNGSDYEFFQSNIMHQFLFSKRHILERVRYKYQHYPYDELGKFINDIKQGKRQKVIFSSGLYSTLKKLLKAEMDGIRRETVPKYLEIIIKRHKPIDLQITYNGKKVKAADLDLEVMLETNNVDYKQVNILDKKNNQLIKPDGYTYEQIQQIIIKYKGDEFVFKPHEKIFNLPHNLMEVNNFISQYSFEEIPIWKIDIVETTTSIGIKLTNVVEANIVKSKPVRLQEVKNIKK